MRSAIYTHYYFNWIKLLCIYYIPTKKQNKDSLNNNYNLIGSSYLSNYVFIIYLQKNKTRTVLTINFDGMEVVTVGEITLQQCSISTNCWGVCIRTEIESTNLLRFD